MTDAILTSVTERWRTHLGGGSRCLAWSSDGRLLAVGADGRALIRAPGSVTPPVGPDPVDAVWRRNEQVIIVDSVVGVVVAGSGTVETRPVEGSRCAGFGRDRIAVAGDDAVTFFEALDLEQPATIDTTVGQSQALCPLGGAMWAVGGCEGLALIDATLGCVDSVVNLDGVRHLAYSPGAERLTVLDGSCTTHAITLADPTSDASLDIEATHIDTDPTGRHLVTAHRHELTWWQIDARAGTTSRGSVEASSRAPITALAMGEGGLAAAGDAAGVVTIWSPLLPGQPIASIELDSEILQLAWRRGGRSLSAGAMSGEIVVADIARGSLI